MRRSWRVRHPLNRAGAVVGHSAGRGGPAPAPGPQTGQPPRVPGGTQVTSPLDALSGALAGATKQGTATILGGGQVLLGLALLVAGLLVATGIGARAAKGGARAGLFAASRGLIR